KPHTMSKRDWSSDVCSSDLLSTGKSRWFSTTIYRWISACALLRAPSCAKLARSRVLAAATTKAHQDRSSSSKSASKAVPTWVRQDRKSGGKGKRGEGQEARG